MKALLRVGSGGLWSILLLITITNASIEDEYNEIEEPNWNDEDILQKLAYEDILELIHTLPPAYQTVFNLYAIEGYNHKEIGELLNISEGTSKSNLSKARMKLQKKIQEMFQLKTDKRYV